MHSLRLPSVGLLLLPKTAKSARCRLGVWQRHPWKIQHRISKQTLFLFQHVRRSHKMFQLEFLSITKRLQGKFDGMTCDTTTTSGLAKEIRAFRGQRRRCTFPRTTYLPASTVDKPSIGPWFVPTSNCVLSVCKKSTLFSPGFSRAWRIQTERSILECV